MRAQILSAKQDQAKIRQDQVSAHKPFAASFEIEKESEASEEHRCDLPGPAEVMERNQTQAATGPQRYSAGGYEASWGTYSVDKRAHTFTFHIEGALIRSLIGKDLPRAYEFSGNQLIVTSTRSDEHQRVAWERYSRKNMTNPNTPHSALTPEDIQAVSPALASYMQKSVTEDLWKRPDLSRRDPV